MKRIFDKEIIASYIKNCIYREFLEELSIELFLVQYEEGEFVTSPFHNEVLFQIIAEGSLVLYFIRDDGTRYFLSSGNADYILGDMELFQEQGKNIYAEASQNLTCIAFSIRKNRDLLLNNTYFLRLIAESLSAKIELLATLDATPTCLAERVLTYMKYKCEAGILKGLEQAAFQLHCSSRQLQRIMNDCERNNSVKKIGKGTYQLVFKD